MKQRLKKLHSWIGLYLGLVFVFIGLTGSILVFDHSIDELFYSDLLVDENVETRHQSIDVLIENAQNALPKTAKLFRISAPRLEQRNYLAEAKIETDNGLERLELYLNPVSGEVVGTRLRDSHIMRFFYRLHDRWLLGTTGRQIVGWTGLVFLLHLLAGIVLWWPKSGTRSFPLRTKTVPFLKWYDVHKLLGITFGALLIISTATGFLLVHKKDLALWLSVPTYPLIKEMRVTDITNKNLSYTALKKSAEQVFRGADFTSITLPKNDSSPVRVTWQQNGETRVSKGMSRVWLNPYNGEILGIRDAKKLPRFYAIMEWAFPLHNGEKLGIFGRILVLILGWIPLILFISGYQMSRLRRSR